MSEHSFCSKCGTRLHGADQSRGTCPRCLMGLGLATTPLRDPSGARPAGAPPELEEIAELLPRYELLELLGRGGMGAVYKARQRDLQRIVAIKVLLPDLGQDPAFAERFLREAQALANLNHEGIVDVYDFGQAEGVYYFVMEYVDGASLRQLAGTQELGSAETLGIVSQICAALQYAHDHGVVHRDVKPENILVDRQGRVKITDFGLAKLGAGTADGLRLTRSDQVMGTLHYMAPEQIERPQHVDHRADLYSLGVVFYELLTGELPLGRFPPPSARRGVDGRLDEVVLRALEKQPERRYQKASQLEHDLDHISRHAPPAAPPAHVGAGPSRPSSRHRKRLWILIGCAGLGVMAAGLVALLVVVQVRQQATRSHSEALMAVEESRRLGQELQQRRHEFATRLRARAEDLRPRVAAGRLSFVDDVQVTPNDEALREALASDEPSATRFARTMQRVREQYLRAERQARGPIVNVVPGGESGASVVHLRLGSFAEERESLRRDCLSELRELRGGEPGDRLDEDFFRELMPFGDRAWTLEMSAEEDGRLNWKATPDPRGIDESSRIGSSLTPPYWAYRLLRDHANRLLAPGAAAAEPTAPRNRTSQRSARLDLDSENGLSGSYASERRSGGGAEDSSEASASISFAGMLMVAAVLFVGVVLATVMVVVFVAHIRRARRERARGGPS